jgi:hypothetical protein
MTLACCCLHPLHSHVHCLPQPQPQLTPRCSHVFCLPPPPPSRTCPRARPADDFKIVVVEAIRSLCLKFPAKYRALMNFLSSVLREEGGFEYKKAIVSSILQVGGGRLWGVAEGDDCATVASNAGAQPSRACALLCCDAL